MAVGSLVTTYAEGYQYALILSYGDVALLVTVFYDYLTHLGEEVELIWIRKFTYISLWYLLMRYLGMAFVLLLCVYRLPIFLLSPTLWPLSLHRCETLYVATMALKAALLSLVQGLMAHRVHVLYRPSRAIAILLLALFIASQATALASLLFVTEQETRAYLLVGNAYCPVPQFKLSQEDGWMSTLNVSVPISFEVVLCALAVFRWFTRLRSTRRQFKTRVVNDLLTTLIRDNIAYFVIALICLCISSKWAMPQSDVGKLTIGAAWYINFLYAGQVVMFSLCGPRMILNIRQFYNEEPAVERSTAEAYDRQLTTVMLHEFPSGASVGEA